jgi:hypothetical protein
MGIGGQNQSAPTRMSETQDELATLQAVINDLDETVAAVESRLEFVLRKNTKGENPECEKEIERVGLANAIKLHRRKVADLVMKLRGIVERIEL